MAYLRCPCPTASARAERLPSARHLGLRPEEQDIETDPRMSLQSWASAIRRCTEEILIVPVLKMTRTFRCPNPTLHPCSTTLRSARALGVTAVKRWPSPAEEIHHGWNASQPCSDTPIHHRLEPQVMDRVRLNGAIELEKTQTPAHSCQGLAPWRPSSAGKRESFLVEYPLPVPRWACHMDVIAGPFSGPCQFQPVCQERVHVIVDVQQTQFCCFR